MKLMLLIFIVACLASISIISDRGKGRLLHVLFAALVVFVVAYSCVVYMESTVPNPNEYYIIE